MAQHKLDLRENAVDSFNEALTKYRQGLDGDNKAFKFAILHLSHSLELLFKYYVSQAHPLLIYKNPFSKALAKEQTIGLWEAVQFLINEGKTVDKAFVADLSWMKALRNNIEHHAFDMDVATVRRTMGRIVQAINEYHIEISDDSVEDFVSAENLELFNQLADQNERDLGNARLEAKEQSEDGEAHDCGFCGYADVAALENRVMVCKYCESKDEVFGCCICGADELMSQASLWNEEHDAYACSGCISRIQYMN